MSIFNDLVDLAGDAVDDFVDGVDDVINDFSNVIEGNDTLIGTSTDDDIDGDTGDDYLDGLGGNDALDGGTGDDTLVGGLGNDTLTGDADADTFVFNYLLEGIDVINDFKFFEGDKIQISQIGFGASSTNQFTYDNSTGALFFEQTPFALLQPNLGGGFIPELDITLV